VALGTIYRYFPSKDSLLLAVMVHWLGDLEQRVSRRPPTGDTTVERIMDVMTRALGSMDRDPRLTAAHDLVGQRHGRHRLGRRRAAGGRRAARGALRLVAPRRRQRARSTAVDARSTPPARTRIVAD
jgi:AcrR family transcriptional regulator